MPNIPYTRATERFRCSGIDLTNPSDSLKPGYYPYLLNVRAFSDGTIMPRQGVTSTSTGINTKTPLHTVRRLNSPMTSTSTGAENWTRIAGTGNAVGYGTGTLTQATYNASNVAYDGNPLILTPYRPDQATSPFMYIAAQVGHDIGSSVLRQLKINRAGTVHQWGLPPPLVPPTVELGTSGLGANGNAVIAQANLNAMTVDGTVATGAATQNRVDVATITVTKIIFDDTGTKLWASVVPSSMADIGTGMIIQFNPVGVHDVVRIAEIYPGGAATTIAAINYLSGTAGDCNIVPTTSTPEMVKNAVIKIVTGGTTNYYRILSAVKGSDDKISIRVNTGANNESTAATTLQVVGSFRSLCSLVDVDTDPLSATARDAAFALSGTDAFGYFSSAVTRDLTKIPSGDGLFVTTGVYMGQDDYFHVSLWCSDWSKVNGGRIVFNVDPAENPSWTAGVKYSLSKNFYYRQFTANDLTPESQNAQTPIDSTVNRINRHVIDRGIGRGKRDDDPFFDRVIDRPEPTVPDQPVEPIIPDSPRNQIGTGSNQWAEIRFKKADCVRVGNIANGDWSSSRHIVFEFNILGSCNIRVNSMSAWGGYKPDIGDVGAPYQYRYRYRVSSTGATSNWSPPSLNGVKALRQQVSIVTTAPTNTPEVDRVDIQRFGGALTNWTYIGTINASSGTFSDNYGDDDIAANAVFSDGDTNYQPWPIRSAPVSGTTATSGATSAGVAGTLVRDTSTTFNQSWAKGTPIVVNGIYTAIRRVHSTSLLEVDDSLGSQSAITWEIPEPLVFGVPLPSFWTWEDRGFACGDYNNPGVLYWTNGNNIDGTQDTSYLEITSPSEPLMNGCAFNGKNYVWSTERMFELEQIAPGVFIAIQIPGNKGLASIYGLAVGERIWYASRDGIYQTGGGDSISITDETLRQLFVKEGNVGTAVNGFNSPDFTAPNKIRLSYYDGYLYFVYQDTSGAIRSMAYTVRNEKPGWWPDSYLDGRGIVYFYGEEGAVYTSNKPSSIVHSLLACGNDTTTGQLYKVNGAADGAGPIAATVRTQYFDGQDRRADKRWGDLIIDANTNSTALTIAAYINNSTSTGLSLSPTTMTSTSRAQQVIDISSGGDPAADYSRNVALEINWSSTSAIPELFLWEPSYTIRPESANLRASVWEDLSMEGDKFFQGVEITADTNNVARTVQVEYDGASTNVADTLTVQHNNKITKSYAFRPAFTAGTVRLHPTDTGGSWKLYGIRWIAQPEPPLGERWESQPSAYNADGFIHMKAAYVTMKSTQNVTMTITRQEDSHTDTYTIPTTSGLKLRQYVPFVVTKGKLYTTVFSTTSTGGQFRLYKDGTTFLMKPWQSEEAFADRAVFGAPTGSGQSPI